MLLNEKKLFHHDLLAIYDINTLLGLGQARDSVPVPSVTVATRARRMMMMVFLFIILIEFYTQYIVMRDIF